MKRRRSPEVIAGRVNADGSIAAGDGFTVTKGTTGLYTVNFVGLFRLQAATASSFTNSRVASIASQTATSMVVQLLTSNTIVLDDQPFSFIAVGVQT